MVEMIVKGNDRGQLDNKQQREDESLNESSSSRTKKMLSDPMVRLRIKQQDLGEGKFPEEFLVELEEKIRSSESEDERISVELELSKEDDRMMKEGPGEGGGGESVNKNDSKLEGWSTFDRFQIGLANVYVQSENFKSRYDKILLDVEVFVVVDLNENKSSSFSRPSDRSNRSPGKKDYRHHDSDSDRVSKRFDTVALGGTFDHLHSGHKILLTMAIWLTSKRIIIGITDDELLKTKKFKEALEPISKRESSVKNFIERQLKFNSSSIGRGESSKETEGRDLKIETVRLKDIYGPTSEDPNIQAILVSRETLGGARSINELRVERGLNELETFVIDVIGSDKICLGDGFENVKMSSTEIRKWLINKNNKDKRTEK